jgi:hypothetical protein
MLPSRKPAFLAVLGMLLGACTTVNQTGTSTTTTRHPMTPPAISRGMIRVSIEDPPSGFPATLKARAQCENGPFQGKDAGTVVSGGIGNKYWIAVHAVDPQLSADLVVPVPPVASVQTPRNHPTRWLDNAGVKPPIRSLTHNAWRGTMIVTYEVKEGDFPSGERAEAYSGARIAFSWWCTKMVPREPG